MSLWLENQDAIINNHEQQGRNKNQLGKNASRGKYYPPLRPPEKVRLRKESDRKSRLPEFVKNFLHGLQCFLPEYVGKRGKYQNAQKVMKGYATISAAFFLKTD